VSLEGEDTIRAYYSVPQWMPPKKANGEGNAPKHSMNIFQKKGRG
jgi:hypothetical protein